MAKRSRTERREAARATAKLARARMKLASLEPGGAPARPIEVSSASAVEPHAEGMPCAACGVPGVRVEEHAARTLRDERGDERRLRIARVVCPRCGTRRDVFFRLAEALPN